MSIDQLITLDLSDEIDRLPKHAGYSILPARAKERHITLHYSGVSYPPASTRSGEIQRILAEATYQLNHNYGEAGGQPFYPDGLLYDLVILSDGTIVNTRSPRVQLWHAGNTTANQTSWAVHLMLGPAQDATPPQWAATIKVFEALCADLSIGRSAVVGHCEWPRGAGAARPRRTYKPLLIAQSECPGAILHKRLVVWRASAPVPPTDPLTAATLPGPNGASYSCSAAAAGFYLSHGGLSFLGYPLANEARSTGLDNRPCSYLTCERAVIKTVAADPTHLALLSEASAKGWF